MARSAVRLLLLFFSVLLVIIALRSSNQWPSKARVPTYMSGGTSSQQWQHASKAHADTRTKWGKLRHHYPLKQYAGLPKGFAERMPRIQYPFLPEKPEVRKTRERRLKIVFDSFTHAWDGYKTYAWMKDELKPLSAGSSNNWGGWAATLVDSLDALWIMGIHEEFDEAVSAAVNIDFTRASIASVNTFETNIRFLGGFLAAYDLSGRAELLDKAIELGEMLYTAFDTPNHMPVTRWEWAKALKGEKQQAASNALLAELGSFSLEFTRLSQITGDPKYYDAIQRITEMLRDQQDTTRLPGLWPVLCNAQKMDCTNFHVFSLGAMADSAYEYLAKEHLLLGGQVSDYQTMYEKAIDAAQKHLIFQPNLPNNPDVLMTGVLKLKGTQKTFDPQVNHLVCYLGGLMGLGSKVFDRGTDLEVARKLTEGCLWGYDATKKGIMPETFRVIPCPADDDDCEWDDYKWQEEAIKLAKERNGGLAVSLEELRLPKGMTSVPNRKYILRPEAIESVFVMYRLTGNPDWMDKGWKMFKMIEQHTRGDIGHATLADVTTEDVGPDGPNIDKMESFWLAETLKYLYLLFADPNWVSLDDYVFNTEGHPFKRPSGT